MSLVCGLIAMFEDRPLRGLLLEAAVSLSLIVALEIFFRRLLESIETARQHAEAANELAERNGHRIWTPANRSFKTESTNGIVGTR